MLGHCMMWLCNTNVFNDTSCIDAETFNKHPQHNKFHKI